MSKLPLRIRLVTVLLSMTSSWMFNPRLVFHWSTMNWLIVLLAVGLRVSSLNWFNVAAVTLALTSSALAAAGSKLWALSEVSAPAIPCGMNDWYALSVSCKTSTVSFWRSIDLAYAIRTSALSNGAFLVLKSIQNVVSVGNR